MSALMRWRHVPSGTYATFAGEDRDVHGVPYAVMETDDGVRARIDPLDLMGDDWERAPTGEQRRDVE